MAESEPNPQTETNPYAPTASTSALEEELSRELMEFTEDVYEPSTFGMTALRWFSICTVCAIPSFLLGLGVTESHFAGMIVGILIFAAGYTLADYLTARQPWRARKQIRQTLKIAYGTRIAITVLFPVGYVLDLMCGAFALNATKTITARGLSPEDGDPEFLLVLLTTLIQGTIMNAIVAVYGLLVLFILLLIGWLRR